MTRIVKTKVTCSSCGTKYAGLNAASYSIEHGEPQIQPLKCPECGNPWTSEQTADTESIIGNSDALKGYDKDTNIFPEETEVPTSEVQ